MEDIGTKDDWAAAQRVFILSRVAKGMGVSTENSQKPKGDRAGATDLAGLRRRQYWADED
jgi:hypothetical protein